MAQERKSLTEVLVSAETAVLVEKWRQIACRNCYRYKSQHADGQCLFDSTEFEPFDYEELHRLAMSKFTRNDVMLKHIREALAREEEGV